jgi:hypothetical protein
VRALFAAIPTYGVNKWCFIAGVNNIAGVVADQRIYHGDLSTPVREASSYSLQDLGAGAGGDDSAESLVIGNGDTDSQPFPGRIGVMALYNRALTQQDIRELQYVLLMQAPLPARWRKGLAGLWVMGRNGTGLASYSTSFATTENPLSDGSKWTTSTGDFNLNATGGTVRPADAAQTCTMYVNSTGLPTVSGNQFAQATIVAHGGAQNGSVMTRAQGDRTYYLWGANSATTFELYRRSEGGGFTALGTVTQSWVANDVVRLESDGSNHRCYINAVLKQTINNTVITGGRPGIHMYDDTPANTQLDSYSCGDLGTVYDLSGNGNHGIITGAVVGAGPPISPILIGQWKRRAFTAAAVVPHPSAYFSDGGRWR